MIDRSALKGFKYYYFELKDDRDETVIGTNKALSFLDDWESIVVQVRKFKTKKLYDSFIAVLNLNKESNKVLPATPPTKSQKLSSAEMDSAKRLAAESEDSSPSNEIVATWKTTSHSTLVVVFIELLTAEGNIPWCWKPLVVIGTLSRWPQFFKVNDEEFGNFLRSLSHAFVRDPTSVDPNKKLVTLFNPSPGKTINIDNHILYGYVNIPVDDLGSTEEEKNWINERMNLLLDQFRTLMELPLFEAALKEKTYKKDYIEKIFNPVKGLNLPYFLSTSRNRVEMVGHLTDHVVKTEADIIMSHLYNNRQIEKKYVVQEEEEEEEEQESVGSNQDDGEEEEDGGGKPKAVASDEENQEEEDADPKNKENGEDSEDEDEKQ
jgi:hypothetical protein